ncbi:MAG: chemotaxis protein CheX [Candidatus Hydrogenedentes bacterium]|nr:chemotaxis protein CheX [Candidatus Hydrogenedentota bacterium]
MKAELINPFIESLNDIFNTMLSGNLRRGPLAISKADSHPYDLMAVIGITGEAAGTVGISFPKETAMKLVGSLLGAELTGIDQVAIDGISEMVNMVAGGAKAKLSNEGGFPLSLSLPNVIVGNNYVVEYPTGTMWLEVPFESDFGAILLRVNFQNPPES